MPESANRYSAFISYARADEGHARWLQRRLETYRLPRRLHASAPRLLPVFRDRVELSAAADLDKSLKDALAASAWLIVICSPAAAQSRWVAREIELFRELHGPDRVLAALVEGEPHAAFPVALLGAGGGAPLAADFRPRGDGRRLGTLKLVASIAGVRLDSLIERDAQRRARRFGIAAVAALMLALAMTALAVVAVRARAAAELQRNKAEGFVDFMLVDLRKRLKGVGKLELLTAVNKRAMSYYDGMDLARLPPDSLERRAALLHAMGEDDEKRGNLAAARAQWQEARRTTAALMAAAPNDAKRIFAHSQSEYWVGFAAWRGGDLAAAERAFREYSRLTDVMLRLDPGNLDYAMEQGYAFSNLGMFTLRAIGDPASAKTLFLKSLVTLRLGSTASPSDIDTKIQIADAYGWIADCLKFQQLFEQARQTRLQQLALLERSLSLDPYNVELRSARVGAKIGLSRIEVAAHRPTIALSILAPVRAEAAILARIDPADVGARDRARAVDLVYTSSWLLLDKKERPSGYDKATYFCAGTINDPEDEIVQWCRLLRSRIIGDIKGRPVANVQIQPLLLKGRYSRRWGIDFRTFSR